MAGGIGITLGDVHKALNDLVAKGAHPGSIDWVLHHQIEWPDGGHHVSGNHLPDEVTDEMVDAFKKAWHEADDEGLAGSRVRAGLQAAITAGDR